MSTYDISKADNSKSNVVLGERSSSSLSSSTLYSSKSNFEKTEKQTLAKTKIETSKSYDNSNDEKSIEDISKPIQVPRPEPYSPKVEALEDPSVILTSPSGTLPRHEGQHPGKCGFYSHLLVINVTNFLCTLQQ